VDRHAWTEHAERIVNHIELSDRGDCAEGRGDDYDRDVGEPGSRLVEALALSFCATVE